MHPFVLSLAGMLGANSLSGAEPSQGGDDAQPVQVAQGRRPGFYGFPGWDGNFGGYYERSDEDMLALWAVAVAETRALLEGGWA